MRAFVGKAERNVTTDATTGAGNEGDFSTEFPTRSVVAPGEASPRGIAAPEYITRELESRQPARATTSSAPGGHMPGVFNVQAYGATGDGISDDSTAIQSALSAA